MNNAGLRAFLAREWRHLAVVNASNRPWQMPLAAALASGLPLLIAAWHGQVGQGVAASLGGLAFLYMPATPLSHRMAWLMACAFGLAGSYTLGLLCHLLPALVVPMLALITILVTMVCRFYAVPPPGSLFFVMAAAIAAYTPVSAAAFAGQVGLVTMGAVLACSIALCYGLWVDHPRGQPPAVQRDFGFVVLDPVVIGLFVGLSLAIAQLLGLERPYWVPVSCLAVIQGVTFRAVWTRQLHRIAGTGVGLLLFWALATWLPLDAWTIAIGVTVLTLVVESIVVRHYAAAAVFFTPLALLLAEGAQLGTMLPQGLIRARFLDTVLGCLAGLAGGACLHSPPLREAAERLLRRMLPACRPLTAYCFVPDSSAASEPSALGAATNSCLSVARR
ncbi:FUSC family protein [Ramlibacter sp. G-1-2-2]|uniref:FUSC family protein n=1 Tax=Ramlibacter agri TaxID=2728837 RepID=A0A848HKE5_9BURK|nr:FUSC family protein [Ramlibacter agri]NML48208.1 FUSC family protein [Ramlibacter agri]